MNKLKLAMNAWRAYSVARHTEGSSLRGMIMSGASVAAVVAITLLRGDLTAADVGYIAAGISGLDAVLKYFIPDQLGQTSDLPPINLIAESQTVRTEGDAGLRPGDGAADPDQLRQSVRPVDYPVRHNTDGAADIGDDFPGWGS
jgi:hypothetical protein